MRVFGPCASCCETASGDTQVNSLMAIWRLLGPARQRQFALLQLLVLLSAFSTLFGIASLVPFLLVAADPSQIETTPLLAWMRQALPFDSDRGFVLALGAGFVLAVLVSNVMSLFSTLAISRFALRVGDEFHAALLDEYLHRDYLFHARVGSGNLFNRVVFSTNRAAGGIFESGMLIIASSATIALIAGSIVVVNPLVALVAVSWLAISYLLLYSAARRRLHRNGLEEAGLISTRARVAHESLAAVKEIQLLSMQSAFSGAFARACSSISRITLSSQAIGQMPKHALECITVAGLVGVTLVASGERNVGSWLAQLSFLGFAAYRLLPAVQQIFVSVVRIRANRALFEEIAEDLAHAMHRRRQGEVRPEPATPAIVPRQEIELEAVSFAFEAGNAATLHEISLRIPAGALVGIAGPNGAGKTTLIDVVMGFLPPTRGRLLIDGVAIDSQNVSAWQRSIAYVPQSVQLLNATLAENIAFGVPDAHVNPTRLREALSRAQLDGLVSGFPRGVHELIGSGGRVLSGGERQRVGIARALYRDAPVLVMDEATSSLDGLGEHEIVAVLHGLRGSGRTVLFVAHRLHSLRECDVIFEMEAGKVVASGTYSELIGRSASFRRTAALATGIGE
jgi:ABC-type multidrug transport system fused ATPase/permease subunit